jgi:transcriptional regulator with XRE-family HTH domain
MNIKNLSDLKSLRLERKWSQEQVAELSGLNVRTIQRIEKGETASLDSIKALNILFEVDFVNDNSAIILEQAKEEERYIQNLKGFYKLVAAGMLSLMLPLYQAIMGQSWKTFLWVLFSWIIILIIYSINRFEFFDENWRKRALDKKFGKRS